MICEDFCVDYQDAVTQHCTEVDLQQVKVNFYIFYGKIKL